MSHKKQTITRLLLPTPITLLADKAIEQRPYHRNQCGQYDRMNGEKDRPVSIVRNHRDTSN
jgi:hypothetical protein